MVYNTIIANEDGKEFKGYLAKPEGGAKGHGLVLMHEVYSVTPGLAEIADIFAKQGYLVLAPNMYWEKEENASFKYEKATGGKTPELEKDHAAARALMFDLVPQNEKQLDYMEKARAFLQKHDASDGSVSVSGFCLGGRGSVLAMMNQMDFDAGIAFYPTPELHKIFTRAAAMSIKKPFMFVVGGEDPYITDGEKNDIRAVSGHVLTYVAGLNAPIVEKNDAGNPQIVTLYYANSNHGWNRRDSKYSDPGTSEHTLGIAAQFLRSGIAGKVASIPRDALVTTPNSPTYHPQPKR